MKTHLCLRFFAGAISLVLSVSGVAELINTPRQETWVTDGPVYAIEATPPTVYIGGWFSYVGPHTGGGVPLSMAAGAPITPFPKLNGYVYTAAPDGSGGWYIGGEFDSVGNAVRSNIAHILPSGAVDPGWNSDANNAVLALAVSGTTVYAGGEFTSVGGQARNGIAALDAITGAVTPWDPNTDGSVYALAISGSTVYVGGWFTSIGGQPRNAIAALDTTTGTATAWDPNAQYYDGFSLYRGCVYALALSGSTVYAGGYFTLIGGQYRYHLAALDATTGEATSWSTGADGTVYALAVSGSTVYAGGAFTSVGGQIRNQIAAVDAITGDVKEWNPNPNSYVETLAVSGSTVYVGGGFTSIGGQTRYGLAALDATTGAATSWNPNANDEVFALAVSGSTVYAAGAFDSVGGFLRNNIAALDAATGAATSWNPNADNYVRTLAVSGSTVYAGGGFTTIGGQTRLGIAALDAATGAATSWNPNADDEVDALAISGDTVYASGWFSSIGGQTRSGIAALDAATGTATAWNPYAEGQVYALAILDGTVYVGGLFSIIGGQSRYYIAALNPTTGLATPWNPGANDGLEVLAVSGNIVYAGGFFTTIGGQPRSRIAALDATTGAATSWNPNADDIVWDLAVSGNTAYVGGEFAVIGGYARSFLAAVDATTGVATPWFPNAQGRVYSLAAVGQTVYVGGGFTSIGGQQRSYFAQFDDLSARTLTTGVEGGGTIDPSAGIHTYSLGQSVVVTATPYAGWRFDHWEGAVSGSTNPVTVVMDADKTVTAVFVLTGAPAYYVSPTGSDSNDGLSSDTPLRTIQLAIDQAAAEASATVRSAVYLAAGAYAVDEAVRVRSRVDLYGSDPFTTVIETAGESVETEYYGVILAARASLRNCTVRLPETVAALSRAVLVYIPNGTGIHVSRCILDGSANPGPALGGVWSAGVEIHGGTRFDATIAETWFLGLTTGLVAVDSGVNVSRNRFESLGEDGVYAETLLGKGLRQSGATPLLGDEGDAETTGLNTFREIGRYALHNRTGEEVKAQLNDWGKYTAGAIAEAIEGPADTSSFLGKGIGPGSIVAKVVDASGALIPQSANPACVLPGPPVVVGEWDANTGRFVFASVQEGNVTVEARATGYVTRRVTAAVSPMNATPVTVQLTRSGTPPPPSPTCGGGGKAAYAGGMLAFWAAAKRRKRAQVTRSRV